MVDLGIKMASIIFPEFKYDWLAWEFRVNLPRETDFRLEAKNCKRCKELFKNDPYVCVPKIKDDLVTQRVLVMSFEDGESIGSIKKI